MSGNLRETFSRTNQSLLRYVLVPVSTVLLLIFLSVSTVCFLASYWWFDRYETSLIVTAPVNVLEECTSETRSGRYGDPVARSAKFNPATYRCGLIETDAGFFALPQSGWRFWRDSRASMLERLVQGESYHAVFISPSVAPDHNGKFIRKDGQRYLVSPPPTIVRLREVAD